MGIWDFEISFAFSPVLAFELAGQADVAAVRSIPASWERGLPPEWRGAAPEPSADRRPAEPPVRVSKIV